MGPTNCHKVCFPLHGVPTITRVLSMLESCGIRRHVVVVGVQAGQVVQTVGRVFPGAVFVYQPEPLGTADAARVGARALDGAGPDAELLLVAADRVVALPTLGALLDRFYADPCDLMFLATPPNPESSQGRLIESADQEPVAILEDADLRRAEVLQELRKRAATEDLSQDRVRQLILEGFVRSGTQPNERKLQRAFGRLWTAVRDGGTAPVGWEESLGGDEEAGGALADPSESRRRCWLNNSVYLLRLGALRYALARLDRHNAQGEEYLSGMVGVLSQATPRFQVRTLRVNDPGQLLGYNSPGELALAEAHFRARAVEFSVDSLDRPDPSRSLAEWTDLFAGAATAPGSDGGVQAVFVRCYGEEEACRRERVTAFHELTAAAAERLGPANRVFLVRVPGRLNVLGRHIDHQGGHCNLMTIGCETLAAVRPREDDVVRLFSSEATRYPDRVFRLSDLEPAPGDEGWMAFVDSPAVRSRTLAAAGDWSLYAHAALLRLQKEYRHFRLRGMDLVLAGNIPPGAGLSSSSSVVMAVLEAAARVNRLQIGASGLVGMGGEAEWYVGTRGGSADHAAIKMGCRDRVIRAAFCDFRIEEEVEFPASHVMIVADSGQRAVKSAGARAQFNHRIACYRLGLALLRRQCPGDADRMHHLRDVNARHLGTSLTEIYRMLLRLPPRATREDLDALLGPGIVEPLLAGLGTDGRSDFPIRGVVWFGLAECERAAAYSGQLAAGSLSVIGQLMNISHDGDRVTAKGCSRSRQPWTSPVSDAVLEALMLDLASGEPSRVARAQLARQPGSYGCSTPRIDLLVDLATSTEGVLGAQLAGAGLGGCMMALVRTEAVDALRERLIRGYYEPENVPPNILVCRPIAGAGLLECGREGSQRVGSSVEAARVGDRLDVLTPGDSCDA